LYRYVAVTSAASGASATYSIPASRMGAAFTGGQGAMVVSVAHFREGSPMPAAASAVLAERLVGGCTS
jgi:hypothetical protein